MRIVVDAMGGDNSPDAIIEGAVAASNDFKDIHIALTGPEDTLKRKLNSLEHDADRFSITDAQDIILNEESPVTAVRRKKNSSTVAGMNIVASGEADGFVSAGSTGGVLAAATLILKRADGIYRPALAPVLPAGKGGVLLIDCGANVDCKPEFLAQFAVMGSAYMEKVIGVNNPKVGLINNGAEAGKGNKLTKEAYPLVELMPVNFAGNLEGRYITSGEYDVAVCDGFVGNAILKFMEGMASTIFSMLKQEFTATTRSKIGAMMLKPALGNFKKSTDYTEYGGAPLLGVVKPVVKAHGSSNAKAFYHAVRQCRDMVKNDVVGTINSAMATVDLDKLL